MHDECVCACVLPVPQFVQIMDSRPPIKNKIASLCVRQKNAKVMQNTLCTHPQTQAGSANTVSVDQYQRKLID